MGKDAEAVKVETLTEEKSKAVSDDELRKKTSRSVRVKIIALTAMAAVFLFATLAWFTIGTSTSLKGLNMTANDVPFELKTIGTDVGLNEEILTTNGYQEGATEYGEQGTTSNETSGEIQKIYWLMNDESNMDNLKDAETASEDDTSVGINPGSYGSLTFYIVPNVSKTMSVTFNIATKAYDVTQATTDASGHTVAATTTQVTDTNTINYISGHIVFFENRDESSGTYSSLINGGTFTKEFTFTKGKEQTVTIYWVWPETFGQFLLSSTDSNLSGKTTIFKNDDEKTKFAENMITNYANYFVADTIAENGALKSEYQTLIRNMAAGATYTIADFTTLNTAYNSADEVIGTTANRLFVELTTGNTDNGT